LALRELEEDLTGDIRDGPGREKKLNEVVNSDG
jgi:hypothetical protein